MERNRRKVLEGILVSNKMQKTATVLIVRQVRHEKYEKLVEKRKKYYAHCEDAAALQIGQKVKIMECRPISKIKKWRVVAP